MRTKIVVLAEDRDSPLGEVRFEWDGTSSSVKIWRHGLDGEGGVQTNQMDSPLLRLEDAYGDEFRMVLEELWERVAEWVADEVSADAGSS